MNQKEYKVIEDLSNNVKVMNKSLKDLNDTLKKNNSRTNKNSLMNHLVDAVKDVAKSLKKSD